MTDSDIMTPPEPDAHGSSHPAPGAVTSGKDLAAELEAAILRLAPLAAESAAAAESVLAQPGAAPAEPGDFDTPELEDAALVETHLVGPATAVPSEPVRDGAQAAASEIEVTPGRDAMAQIHDLTGEQHEPVAADHERPVSAAISAEPVSELRMLEPSVLEEVAQDPAAAARSDPVDLEPVKRAMLELAPLAPVVTAESLTPERPSPVPASIVAVDEDKTRISSIGPEPAPVARIGVLLVNLGTPEAADAPSVRRYLKEFLSDKRVIENDGLLWRLAFRWIILPFRPRSRARAYRKIWNKERNESPLKTITRAQAEKLSATLAGLNSGIVVDWAMRYGKPSIPARLEAFAKSGCDRILLMPLYPQYSAPTTATACDVAFQTLMKMRRQPALRVAAPYYDNATYIEALASSIETQMHSLNFKPDVILASYHGMPQDYVKRGDPYEQHCIETTRLLRERLGLDETKLMMSFQSRFGRGKWLQPFTDKTVKKLAKSGVKNLAVVTPGFSADCLETLEEIAIENAAIFKRQGGEKFVTIPCLNDSEPGMTVLWQNALRELKGWV